MSFLSDLGANTLGKFTSIVNNYVRYGSTISQGSVNLYLPDGSGGISHAVDLKKKMADIEWSRGYSWDVYLSPSPPAPFNGTAYGIPVVEVQSDYALLGESTDIPAANSTYRAPIRKNLFDIKVTMLDDEKGTMEQYFEDWMNSVYLWDGDTQVSRGSINFLDKSVRQLTLTKLNSKKKEIFTRQYLVYPEANLSSFNDSTGGVRNFTINLVVAGYLGKTAGSSYNSLLSGGQISGWNKASSLSDIIRQKTEPVSIYSDNWLSYTSSSPYDVRDNRSDFQKAVDDVMPNIPSSIF